MAGAIVVKLVISATDPTQNKLECSPGEIKQHYDLAKVAILVELF